MSGKGHTGCAFTFTPAGVGEEFVIASQCLVTQHNTEDGALNQPADLTSGLSPRTQGRTSCSNGLISLNLSFLICNMDQIIPARLEAECCWVGGRGQPVNTNHLFFFKKCVTLHRQIIFSTIFILFGTLSPAYPHPDSSLLK